MISTLILKHEHSNDSELQEKIQTCFPKLEFTFYDSPQKNCIQSIQRISPGLVFLEIEQCSQRCMEVLTYSQNQKYETILFSSERRFILKLIKYRISGYLLKPINAEALRNTVELAIHRIEYSQKNTPIRYQTSPPSVIGIPTMDGYEFITIANIIRCESYLKCTRVITTDRPDIISSYNIGEFIKVLEGKAFYRSHQSHLINLNKVKTYLKEGTIIMQDNSSVPVSRRKRAEFLKAIPHL